MGMFFKKCCKLERSSSTDAIFIALFYCHESCCSVSIGHMEPKDCTDCHRLRERFWEISAELDRSEDELSMTRKNAVDYAAKKADVLRLRGLFKEARVLSSNHSEEHRR